MQDELGKLAKENYDHRSATHTDIATQQKIDSPTSPMRFQAATTECNEQALHNSKIRG